MRRRDSCSFVDACKTLGCWGNITAGERTELTCRQQKRDWNRQREAAQADAERRERLQLRNELHTTVSVYHELAKRLHELGPIPEAEPLWECLPVVLNVLRIDDAEFCCAAGLENFYGR